MIYKNEIVHGDCIDIMRGIPENSIDLIVTSPPYNIGIPYDGYHDNMEWSLYYLWCKFWLSYCLRVLKLDGRMVLNHYLSLGNSKYRTAPLMELNHIAIGLGFKHHSCAIWTDVTLSNKTAWGSFMSASSPYVNSPFEGILILFKDHWKKDKSGISDISKKDFVNLTHGIWDIKTETHGLTPACFNIDFAEKCIKLLSYQNDLVLDPFSGSGTVALACHINKRNFIAIEQSEKYCRISRERISQQVLNI